MGEWVNLTAADGHSFAAYRSGAEGPGLVVIQEIFGVNSHIRSVVDRFAAAGFAAIAPALFDRVEPGLELGYEADDVAQGRALKGQVTNAQALCDIDRCIDLLSGEERAVGMVGYCWGGSLVWAAATGRQALSAAVGYYGGEIVKSAGATPNCPVMLHFGETDHAIPMMDVETIRAAQPDMAIFTYPAGHGFSCDARASYDEDSHQRALAHTLPFLHEHLSA